jgi:hypothetical protein
MDRRKGAAMSECYETHSRGMQASRGPVGFRRAARASRLPLMLLSMIGGGVLAPAAAQAESGVQGLRLCEASQGSGAYVVETSGKLRDVQVAITAQADREQRVGTLQAPTQHSVIHFSVDGVGGAYFGAERGEQNLPGGQGYIRPGRSASLLVNLARAHYMAPAGKRGTVERDLFAILARPGRHRINAYVCGLSSTIVTGTITVHLVYHGGQLRLVSAPAASGTIPPGKQRCQVCQGTGKARCNVCRGQGRLGPKLGLPGPGMLCPTCMGTGKAKCGRCNGRGWIEPQAGPSPAAKTGREPSPHSSAERRAPPQRQETVVVEKTCPRCGSKRKLRCSKCSGRGQIVCPKCSGRWRDSSYPEIPGRGRVCPRCQGWGGKPPCDRCGDGNIFYPSKSPGHIKCTGCGGRGVVKTTVTRTVR